MTRMLPVTQLESGMRLARTVLDREGNVLLEAGITLQRAHILRLTRHGITSVYTTSGELDGVAVDEPITQEVRQRAYKSVMGFTESLKSQISMLGAPEDTAEDLESIPRLVQEADVSMPENVMRAVRQAVEVMLEDIMDQPSVGVGLIDLKSLDDPVDSTLNHSIQVATLSLVVGRILGLSSQCLSQLGTGAILHDIGKTLIPSSVLLKPSSLDPAEWRLMAQHPSMGFEVLRKTSGLSIWSAHVALEHHERVDGEGYPRGLEKGKTGLYSRICAVCDVYDAMVSPRVYKPSLHPSEALRHLRENRGSLYDSRVVEALTQVVAPYPLGSVVILNTGEMATVEKIHLQTLDLPQVSAFQDGDGRQYSEAKTYDLSRQRGVKIAAYC